MSEVDYYPAGAYRDPNAPYNQVDVPEKEFDVTCSQSLSRTATIWTNNYIPGASGVDYEDDGEGGSCAVGWHDPDDTSDTNWADEYANNGYKTPLELIALLREYLGKELTEIENSMEPGTRDYRVTRARMLRSLIEECDCWTEDETEIVGG